MDVEKLDESYENARYRALAAWKWVTRVYAKGRDIVGFICLIGMVIFIPWFVWKCWTDHSTRVQFGHSLLKDLKWYLIFGAVGWVISKIWKKKPETENGEEPSVHGGKQKDRRKNNRRLQRGR